ncbi:MAG: Nif3-like dinuclear metal center hexameric protein [Clostridia bacterium]|nr:Nif3-like dinuclear metal center hexameric protein [Clostridia bacterium]
MRLDDFIRMMNEIAPPELAMDFDNVGLLVGRERKEIKKVLVALDCTVQTVSEAAMFGADLLLTHHPIFFTPVKRILPDDPDTAAAYMLIKHGIAHFAMHTNLDKAPGGVNDCLASCLGLNDVIPLPPDELGRIGNLSNPLRLIDLAHFVEEKLDTTVRFCGDENALISKAALIGGSGGSDFMHAHTSGADVLITGEIKHNQALSAKHLGLCMIEAGHYETERVVLLPLINRLQTISNDVQYKLTLSQTSCLRGV